MSTRGSPAATATGRARASTRQSTTKPLSLAKRKAAATERLTSALGANKDAAITAAIEAVTERLAGDRAFQQSLHQKYQELEAISAPIPKADHGPAPMPINPPSLDEYTPYGKFDPYKVLHEYGHDQLRAVLVRASQALLREAVGIVQLRKPGTKPTSRANKAAMVDYIVEQVAGPGY